MAKVKNEAVTVSFHYLIRSIDDGNGGTKDVKFSQAEFDVLYSDLLLKPSIDLKDEKAADQLRFKTQVPLENVSLVDTKTIYGTYKAAYWGHAYDNTAIGKIPADSINLRPFHFLLYLSKAGRLYIASQYLGHFGGYTGLKNTICDLLPNSENIQAHSFRVGGLNMQNISPKEVKVTFAEKATSIAKLNSFTDRGVVAFKKRRGDSTFEDQVKASILPFFGKPKKAVRAGIAAVLNDSGIMDINDEDIEDCSVVAKVNGRDKTIYMLEDSQFASKIPLDVPLNKDGHPEFEPTKKAILKVLENDIIANA